MYDANIWLGYRTYGLPITYMTQKTDVSGVTSF